MEKGTMKLSIQYKIPQHIMERCSKLSGMEITDDPREADAVIFGRNPEYGPNTRLFQCLYAGTDHIDRSEIPGGSVLLSNAGAYSEPVAETVFGLILSQTKWICAHNNDYHNVKFRRRDVSTIYGKTMGIIGYGGIGKKVSQLSHAFGMNVIAYTTHPPKGGNAEFASSPQTVFEKSDMVVLSMPLKPETAGMIGDDLLSRFRGSMIVNIARAGVVDRESMLNFLSRNPDRYYLTDVWWNEPDIAGPIPENAVITPHIGGMGREFLPVAVDRACENLRNYVEGRNSNIVYRT